MMVLETPLERQCPSKPPLVAERTDEEERVPTCMDASQSRDDKLFQRLEEWLLRTEALVDNALRRSLGGRAPARPKKSDFSTTDDADLPISKVKRATLVVAEMDSQERRQQDPNQSPSTDGDRPPKHKELKVALSQTKGLDDPEGRSCRQRATEGLTTAVRLVVNTAYDLASTTLEEEEQTMSCFRRMLARIVKSWLFEAFFGLVILSNSVFIAIQVEAGARDRGNSLDFGYFVVASIYTILFTLELLLRVAVGGPAVFWGPDWAWLLLDVVVVSSSVFEFVLELALQQNEDNTNVLNNMRLLRILRIGRITRAIRIVRLVKFIRSLRQLLYSIGHTLRAMVWSVVLLALIIFLFGLIFTDICSEYLAREPNEIAPNSAGFLEKRFGGLEASMHTLYASITGGLTWVEARDELEQISTVWGLLFEAYIAFCLFAVLNVMTGVFCQSAMESAEKDHELVLQNVVQEKAKYFRAVRRLFAQLDKNADGGITEKEFEAAVDDPALRAVFDALEINAADAWALFHQLDSDGDRNVDVDEFLEGCMMLKGPARSIDVVCIKRDLHTLGKKIEQQAADVKKLHVNFQRLYEQLSQGTPT